MNFKSKKLDYFKEHWKRQIFLKGVCMIVSACIILNIINLPAYANTQEDLRKKAFSRENKQQDVLYQKDTSFNSVSVMNSLEANIKIDKKTENIFVGKELKGFLSKEKDGQGRRKVMVHKGESFEEDEVLTAMVDNKLKGRKSSSGVETRQISQDQRSQDQRSQEQSLSVKEGESTRQQKDKSAQEQESKEEVKEETRQSQSPKEERVAKQQGAKEGVEKEAIEEARREQEQRSKQESQGEQEERETEREGSINAQEQVLQGQRDIDVEKASYTSKRVQELAESLEKEEKDRDKVIEEIAEQTGLSKEQVEEELSKLDEAQRKGVIAALAKLFGQGKDIVYCVAEVLGTVLNETNKGLLGFAAILAEAIAGIFVKNNQDLISGKSEQLMLSAQAIQTVLRKYGKEYVGIDTNIDDIIAGLNVGESAIVHVGTNHFITITKNEDGTFTKTDINKSQETLTAKELKSALEREYGLKEGQTTTVLVKDDNEKFKGIKRVDTLGEVLGAEREEYVGIEININHIIEGLNVGESVIVYVVRDRCVTITKNEDGTFTKTDNVNNTPETLTAQELKRVMVEQYDLKEEQITRVVVRADNEKFKRIVYDLSEAIGAQRQWDKSQFEGKSQEEYYRQYGEESYEKLMIQMYGTTSLSPEQSREFAAFYEKFLEAAIIDIDKTMSDEKASEESKEVAKALKTQAAKELAIIEGTLEVLREHVGVVSGQVGQVLLIQERAYPNESQGIAEGEYYQVITIYADDLKEQHSIVGSDGKSVSIESYRISRGWSISTREGVRVTRSDGSTYQVFGIGGKFEGMEVGFEYIVAYNANGTFYMDEQANIYLLNDTDRVYQAREERGSRPPTSGMYKGAAPERENWTHGKIIETESGYMIYGAGSKITVRKTSRGWEADAIGIGTEAMRGSVLRISANDPNGVAATIFLDIKEGFMVYAGNYWVPSDGFIWQYDESVTAEQIEQFIKNTISTQLGSNAEGIEEIELIYGEAVEAAKAKAKEKAEEEIEEERKKYASEIPPAQYKAAHKKEIEEKAQEYYEDIYEQEVAQTKEDFKNKKMLGAPFSTEAIFKSMGISAKIHTKAGFTYDGTKSDGDIYKLTIESATVLEIKEQDGELVTVATEDIRVKAVISEGGWELDSGGTTLTDSIKQGQVFSFATVLNNAGRQIVNTREIEIITGYEISGHDEKGNNYYDYSKPKYSKMDPGTFKVGGNSDGKYILINNLYISISKGNWEVMQEQSGSQYDKTEENCAYWHEGAQITISKRGNTFDISISKGDLTVKNLTVTLYHKMNDSSGGGDDSDDSYEGPRIEGAYITDYKELYNNMYSYKIQTGTFKGVSGEQGTQNSLGNFMFVPGSDFKKGSIIQADATRAKYDSKIKKDGSIDAYGAKWYEKLRDGIVGFFSILAFSLMTIFTLGAMIWAKEMKGMGWAKEWAAITYGYWNHVEADGSNKEAVQRGMDLGIAGLAAVAILVVAAISIAGSIFTGGASIIGAIGAVVALAGAVASSVSAINLTNSAIQAFRAGKGGQGALMLFFALLTVVLACVGAGQMGSTIASGLATLGKQFFIKMAVGAVIGAAAGAGIAAASYGIRYAIDKSKGRAEDFDWAEFGKEVGIGAITGAFAGAAAGAQVATAVAKSVAKGVAQEVAKGVGEGVAKAVGEEVAEDVSKEITKQVSKEVGEELAGSIAGKVSKDVLSQITGSLTKGVSVEVGKEVAKNVAKEVGEGVAEEVAKDVSKEVAKNVVDDLATNVAKSVEAQIVKELSGEVSKEVGEKIAKSVAEKVAKSISRSIAEKVGEEVPVGVGEIAKELILGGTSFKRQAGQTTLQFVGTVTKSVITVVSRVGMQALNGYMTYMSAKSFVDCMEKGDVLGAAKALYTLVSINIIMPVMSGHSAIKEDGTLKASDLAKEGAGDLTSTAKNTEVVTKGITIQGMSIGWKVGSVAITTVVGAGVGVGISVIIDLVSGKKIKAKDLIIGGGVGATIGFGFGALATKADWTMLGNSVKTSLAKTFAPFAGRTANLVRGADGDIVVQELSEFSGSTMVRSWVGLVGGGAIGVGIGAGIWAVKGHKKEDMARYLIVGGVGGSVVGAGFANAWSSGGYKGAWANFKANPKAVFMEAKGYLQESLVKSVTMVQEINMFNTYMAYSTGILNQIYNKITGESLANTDIVKFINKVTGMSLFKSQADIEEDTEFEKRKKKAQEKGEEFKEEGVVYKAEFGQEEANAVIEQNWGSLTSPTMYASNVVGGFLKPVLGPALQHSPILGSVMNVMESAGSVSIMQKHKIVSMFYNMGVKIRLLNIISKQVFDDPNDPEDDQIAEVLGGFAFMQMFETMAPQTMPAQTQAEAEKFLTSGQEISKMVDGNQIKVALGEEVYNSATLLKKASSKEKFEGNLKTVCSNLGLSYEVVSQEVGLGKNYNQIVSSLVIEYVLKGVSERGALPEQIQKVRSELNTIVETSPIMKQGAGLSSFDIINSISCKLNYLYASAKILELNVEGIRVESIASGSLSKGEYKKILQAQDAKETGSGVVLLMNYLSGISSVNSLPINELIGAVSEYNNKLFELKEATKATLAALKLLNLSEDQINRISEIVLKEGSVSAENKLTEGASQEISKVLGKAGTEVVVKLIVGNLERNINIGSIRNAFENVYSQRTKITIGYMMSMLATSVVSKEDPLTKELMRSLEKQLFRADTYVVYTTFRDSPALKEVGEIESLRNIIQQAKADLTSTLKSLSALKLSDMQINKINEIVLKEGAVGSDNKLTREAQEGIQEVVGSKVVTNLVVRNIEELRSIEGTKLSAEQKGQLALLEAIYMPQEISLNTAINNLVKEVASGKLSYEEFNLVIGASDILYSRVTSVEQRKKLADYRKEITVAAVNMTKEVIKETAKLQKEGQITKGEAKGFSESIRNAFNEVGKVGNISSLMGANANARRMLSSIRERDIVQVVDAQGKFLSFDTSAGKNVIEVNRIESTAKGMKINLTVDGKNIGDVVLKGNLEALSKNEKLAQAIVEKYPNMLATDIALNRALSEAIKPNLEVQANKIIEIASKAESLDADKKVTKEARIEIEEVVGSKDIANKIINSIEDGNIGGVKDVVYSSVEKIIEVLNMQEAFSKEDVNKLTEVSKKTIQELVRNKEVANNIIRSIEEVKFSDLKKALQEALSGPEALVLGEGSFRIDGEGKQIENKGYILSSQAKSAIFNLLGATNATRVIDSIDAQLNTEKIVNDIKTFKTDASQLIKLCSANVNPRAISMLFSHLEADISPPDGKIKMSLADLAILCEQTQNAIAPQLKAMINKMINDKMIDDEKEVEKAVDQLSKYLKDSSLPERETIFEQVKEKVKYSNNVENSQLYEIVNQHLDVSKIVSIAIEEIELMKGEGKSEEEIVDNANLKFVFENSGYLSPDALLPRLKLLREESAGKTRLEMIQEEFYGKGGYVEQAKGFIETNTIEVEGKKKLKEGTIDSLRAKVIAMDLEGKGTEAVNLLRITLNECMRQAVGFGIRGSQSELTTTLQNDINAALGMGGGKTVSLALDAATQRVLMGSALNLEILVGNSDLENYVGGSSQARKFFEFVGMKAVSINDFKPEGGQTNIGKLKEAYQDPNVVVIMDPTMRGHMMNEAVSRGGESGRELREVLESVNRVTVDEVHLWALTRTAAVIGGDNKPPDKGIIKKAVKIGDLINAEKIYKQIIKPGAIEKTITIEKKEVLVKRFNKEADLIEAKVEGEYIAIIGEQTASIEIRMSKGIRDVLINKIGSAPKGYTPAGMLYSVIKGLFTSSENGGMAIGEDGKVKPVGATGVQENMVINDIYSQLGFALKKGIEKRVFDIRGYMSKSTQMSNTSMQTSLAAIYSGASARMVGISGTVSGLEQLIINRTGSGKIYNITGERVDPSMFNSVMEIGTALSKEVIKENLKSLSELNLNESVINDIAEIVAKKGALDGNNKLTQEAQEEIKEIIEKAKAIKNLERNKDSIEDSISIEDRIKIISGSIGDGLRAKITNVLIKAMQDKTLSPDPALNNALLLGKTQGTIENFRSAVKKAIENVGGIEALDGKVEIFEFTDKQGKWTGINEKREVEVSGDLGNNMKSITDVAKNKNIRRIIIANEMGATGVDYQGNYLNIIADAHLMSNTDLAQALKRTARPNNSFSKEGGLQRWTTERVIMYDKVKVQSELDAFKNNGVFVEYAKKLWEGAKAGGNMEDAKSVKWLEVMEKGNFDISNAEVIEGLYKLSGGYKEGDKIDTKSPEVIDIAMKEAITFISKIQDLRSVDGSIRFTINDSIRDRMVLSVLRNVVAGLPEG
ncbi:MAG: hypothetical protein LBP57_00805, partial [Endomicrobium sp.]|nr:hypothetical protein [Endomicrobium sp.]